jgi:hypothetical protein
MHIFKTMKCCKIKIELKIRLKIELKVDNCIVYDLKGGRYARDDIK